MLCPVRAARALLKASAGKGPDAFVVLNLRGQPATKEEVVQEIRAAAKLSGAVGRFTGHSLRVTGAQRLAKAGVCEAKITAFGRWASDAFRLYVRDAVLEASGGELSKVVEAQLAESGGSLQRMLEVSIRWAIGWQPRLSFLQQSKMILLRELPMLRNNDAGMMEQHRSVSILGGGGGL